MLYSSKLGIFVRHYLFALLIVAVDFFLLVYVLQIMKQNQITSEELDIVVIEVEVSNNLGCCSCVSVHVDPRRETVLYSLDSTKCV